MELDASADEPDLFGAHEKWSEQSNEIARWVWPVVLSLIGVACAAAFGSDYMDDPIPAFAILAGIGVAWTIGCIVFAWSGGPWRVEIDQASRRLTWTHMRRFRPTTQSWHFDEIEKIKGLISIKELRDKDDHRVESKTYYVQLILKNGAKVKLFGPNFKVSGSSKLHDECIAKMNKLMGLRQENVDPAEFEKMRAEVEANLAKRGLKPRG
jgi:hypothetical protein